MERVSEEEKAVEQKTTRVKETTRTAAAERDRGVRDGQIQRRR